jgi:hypothetical protein
MDTRVEVEPDRVSRSHAVAALSLLPIEQLIEVVNLGIFPSVGRAKPEIPASVIDRKISRTLTGGYAY